jgi:hypothetical protein
MTGTRGEPGVAPALHIAQLCCDRGPVPHRHAAYSCCILPLTTDQPCHSTAQLCIVLWPWRGTAGRRRRSQQGARQAPNTVAGRGLLAIFSQAGATHSQPASQRSVEAQLLGMLKIPLQWRRLRRALSLLRSEGRRVLRQPPQQPVRGVYGRVGRVSLRLGHHSRL